MHKLFLSLSFALSLGALVPVALTAQSDRQSVPSSEVNGTFQHKFTGKFKGSASEIKILALGNNRLRMAFDLTYPYIDGTGGLMANVGQIEGEAKIEGDKAVFSRHEFGKCEIAVVFVRPGTIKVSEESESAGCGFGHNVRADGIYKRISKLKPKF